MITSRELSYVNGWTKQIPYPGIDYAEQAAEKLISAYENYNDFYKGTKYDIITSSGEQIFFEILEMNLCHMLGIDYKNLSDDYFATYRKNILGLETVPRSYELLTSIINNIENVLRYDMENRGKILNYYRIMIKCSIFEKLSDFSKFNFGIINFNSDEFNLRTGNKFSDKSEKFLYVQSNEAIALIFMMGIVPDESCKNEKIHIVKTLIAPQNVKNYFDNQSVSIPTQILATTSENMQKLEATPSEKIALLNQYKSIIQEYGLESKMNIQADYEAMLVAQTNVKERTKIIGGKQ